MHKLGNLSGTTMVGEPLPWSMIQSIVGAIWGISGQVCSILGVVIIFAAVLSRLGSQERKQKKQLWWVGLLLLFGGMMHAQQAFAGRHLQAEVHFDDGTAANGTTVQLTPVQADQAVVLAEEYEIFVEPVNNLTVNIITVARPTLPVF